MRNRKYRQFGILLEHAAAFCGFGLAFALDARGVGLGVGDGFGGLAVGGGLDFGGLGLAFVLFAWLIALVRSAFMRSNTALGDAFGQADLLDAEKFELNAVVVRLQVRLCTVCSISFSISSNFNCFGSAFTKSDSVCAADDGALGAAQHAFELALRGGARSRREISGKTRWHRKSSSRHRRSTSRLMLSARESLAEFVLEILDALVEFIDLLDRPRPFEIRARRW